MILSHDPDRRSLAQGTYVHFTLMPRPGGSSQTSPKNAAPRRNGCVTLGQAAAATPVLGAGHRSGQAGDRFRCSRRQDRRWPRALAGQHGGLDLVRW
jgi:hypothetical protein